MSSISVCRTVKTKHATVPAPVIPPSSSTHDTNDNINQQQQRQSTLTHSSSTFPFLTSTTNLPALLASSPIGFVNNTSILQSVSASLQS